MVASIWHQAPKGSEHNYKVLEPFTAVEATHPPAELHGREDGQT